MDRDACLALFDANCPEFFAPNERADYATFLDSEPAGYEVCRVGGVVAGAFGVMGEEVAARSLNWILLSPSSQGLGLGSRLVARAVDLAKSTGAGRLDIAASHLSAAFFARFGATVVGELENGWGPGMHRVDMELRW